MKKLGGRAAEQRLVATLFANDISLTPDFFARAAGKRVEERGIVYHPAIQIYYSLLENIVKPGQ